MYFGSVKFFKHFIYTVFFGWLAAATFLAVFFGIKYNLEAEKNTENVTPASVEDSLNIPEDTSLKTLFLIMTRNGYTSEEILDIISETDPEALEAYITKYAADHPEVLGEPVGAGAGLTEEDVTPEYTRLYPDMYVSDPPAKWKEEEGGTIYLTFDDGPSGNTTDVLEILDKYNIKAAFFMCAGEDEKTKERMKAVADAGHTIGVHSISHDYEKIYESVESYLDDFYKTYTCIYEATGVRPRIFRFPGGSINNYNRLIYKQIIAEMTRRGFVYYDWNVSGEDAVRDADWSSIYNNVLKGVRNNSSDRSVVLLHDGYGKDITVTVLEDVIVQLLNDGYGFGQLDETVKPTAFSYRD